MQQLKIELLGDVSRISLERNNDLLHQRSVCFRFRIALQMAGIRLKHYDVFDVSNHYFPGATALNFSCSVNPNDEIITPINTVLHFDVYNLSRMRVDPTLEPLVYSAALNLNRQSRTNDGALLMQEVMRNPPFKFRDIDGYMRYPFSVWLKVVAQG